MLIDTIQSDLEAAIRAHDRDRATCLRMVLSAIKYKQVDMHKDLDDQEVIKVLRSQVKQVSESLEQFTRGKRDDLVEKEENNLKILKAYLPRELSSEEITAIAQQVISETGATKKEMGTVMKQVMPLIAGRADGKVVRDIVSNLLT
ncbi:MAG: GatB/YqeY domain-containing protein [Desulfomonilia bacterium]|nr:GatB/YqeY domain-containing protein [Desulfomonilia bacterium]